MYLDKREDTHPRTGKIALKKRRGNTTKKNGNKLQKTADTLKKGDERGTKNDAHTQLHILSTQEACRNAT